MKQTMCRNKTLLLVAALFLGAALWLYRGDASGLRQAAGQAQTAGARPGAGAHGDAVRGGARRGGRQGGVLRDVAHGGQALTSSGGRRRQQRHFELLESTPSVTRIRFVSGVYSVQEVMDSQGRRRSVVTMEDGWASAKAGKPALPVFRANLAVAHGRERRLSVQNAVWDEHVCAPPVASSGMALRKMASIEVTEDSAVYSGGGSWPSELASMGEPAKIRSVAFAGVTVQPAVYDFTRGVLKICRSCEISVLSDGASSGDYGMLSSNRDFAQIQRRNVLNGGLLNTRGEGTLVGRLAFILPDAWKGNAMLASYVGWRRLQGYEVNVFGYPSETSVNGQSGSGGIRETVRGLYDGWSLTHLVLVGRPDDVPSAVLSASKSLRNYPGTALACSDVEYGLLSGEDVHQDIFLSRLAVASSAELSAVLDKLLSYEQEEYSAGGDESWRTACEYIGGNDVHLDAYSNRPPEYSSYSFDYEAVDGERRRMVDSGAVTKALCRYQTGAVPPGKLDIKGDLEDGAGLVVYMGHGQNTLWKTSSFSIAEAASLKNGGRLPFVSSCVCLTGNFGMTTGKSLAEGFLCATGGGGCGVLASTNETYIFPPMYMMTALDDEVIAAGGSESVYCQGAYVLEAILAGVEYCETTTYKDSGTQAAAAKQMHLIGDCSMSGRFRGLVKPGLTADWVTGASVLRIAVTRGGRPSPGVPVSVHGSGQEALVSGWTDREGCVSLAVSEHVKSQELTVVAYDPLCGMSQVVLPSSVPELDADGDGFISHSELLVYLKVVTEPQARQAGMAAWAASGQQGASTQEASTQAASTQETAAASSSQGVLPCMASMLQEAPAGVSSADAAARTRYCTYGELEVRMRSLCLEAADVCHLVMVGESVQGRRIFGLCLGEDAAEEGVSPELLITGGIMGDERVTVELPMMFAEWLVRHRDDAGVQELLNAGRLYIIPCMNPDGMAALMPGNANGVNLFMSFPDGVKNAGLGMFGNGDSLCLDESLSEEESGRWYKTSQMPETVAFMRWCCSRRFASALLLRSGGLMVTYPYGNNETYSREETPTEDDRLLSSLARGYAECCGLPGISAVNAAVHEPLLGTPSDWLYRYLGMMPLSVWVSAEREPDFRDVPGLFDGHRRGFAAWMKAACTGVGGTVRNASGQPLSFVKVTAGIGKPVYSGSDGTFFRMTEGAAMVQVSVPGYFPVSLYSGVDRQLDVVLTPSSGVTAELLDTNRVVYPERESVLSWRLSGWHGGAEEACIVSIGLSPGSGSMMDEGHFQHVPAAWRREADGKVSLLYDKASAGTRVCDLPVRWGQEVWKDHVVSVQVSMAEGRIDRCWPCCSALPVTLTVSGGHAYSVPGLRVTPLSGQTLFTWNGRFFETVTSEEALTGYWREKAGESVWVRGWYPQEQVLRRGWNLVGVPLPVPSARFGAVFEISGSVYSPVLELLPGRAYWVFSEHGQIMRYD